MRRWLCSEFPALAVIALAAFAFRLPMLGLRPMHHDEANQAVKCGILQTGGIYKYDPQDHHGPSLYYLSLPSIWVTSGRSFSQTSEATFRIIPAIFGTALVLLLYLVRDGQEKRAMVVSALLTAVSPAMVYYSRFYIQEMLLVFFSFGMIAAGWRYVCEKRAIWAGLTGMFAGLMFATKETSVIAFGSMAMALVLTMLWGKKYRTDGTVAANSGWNMQHVVCGVSAAITVSVVLFSSFFMNWPGLLDSVTAFGTYLSRSTNSAHIHPWYYYLQILAWTRCKGLVWSEGLILLLALSGLAIMAVRSGSGEGNPAFPRFLVLYTVFMTVMYSVIPYKTPWCMLSILHGMILLGGFGAVSVLDRISRVSIKIGAAVLLLSAGLHLAWQAYLASFKYYADPRCPYVYAQTSTDFMKLVGRIESLSRVHPQGRDMLIAVVAAREETWPLPWYLRRFTLKGYWEKAGELPEGMDPPVMIASPDQAEAALSRCRRHYHQEHYGLRPDVFLILLVRKDLWNSFMVLQPMTADEVLEDIAGI